MKCLSLYQPWATLVVLGAKRIETRSFPTKHRGVLAIHASKHWQPNKILALIDQEPFRTALGEHRGNLPLGCILGTVRLEDCLPTQAVRDQISDYKAGLRHAAPISPEEFAFGDYSQGRWAWVLSNPVRRVNPIPWRGQMGLFALPQAVVDLLETVPEQIGGDSCKST